jgi:ribosomal protein L32
MRSACKFLRPQSVSLCSNKECSAPKLPHEVCSICGFYRGKKVMTTKMDRSVVRSQARAQKNADVASAQDNQQ